MPGLLDFSDFMPDVRPNRQIDPDAYMLSPQVTVDEDHTDELVITEHPVEQGAVIHDHAYKRPAELRLQIGWAANGGISPTGAVSSDSVDVRVIYEHLLYLQAERRPFTVYTGKRTYQNMLVAVLRTHTDSRLEFALLADVTLREVVLVNTSTGGAGGITSAATKDATQLFNPQSNQSSASTGPMQNLPANVTDDALLAAGAT